MSSYEEMDADRQQDEAEIVRLDVGGNGMIVVQTGPEDPQLGDATRWHPSGKMNHE